MKTIKRFLIGSLIGYWISELFFVPKLEIMDGIITIGILLIISALEMMQGEKEGTHE